MIDFELTEDHKALVQTVREFASVDAPVVALTHVRVIDGTGAAPTEDQSVIVRNQRIAAIGASATLARLGRVLAEASA